MTMKLVWDNERPTVSTHTAKSYMGRRTVNGQREHELRIWPIYSLGAMGLYQQTYELIQSKKVHNYAQQIVDAMDWSLLED